MDRRIASELDQIADLMVDRGVEAAITALDGDLLPDDTHAPDDFKYNPYGIVRGRKRPGFPR